MGIDIEYVQQINGDCRLDDGDEGPLMKLEFFAEFARMFSDDDKYEILKATTQKLMDILQCREAKKVPEEAPRRREAILAQRARNSAAPQ